MRIAILIALALSACASSAPGSPCPAGERLIDWQVIVSRGDWRWTCPRQLELTLEPHGAVWPSLPTYQHTPGHRRSAGARRGSLSTQRGGGGGGASANGANSGAGGNGADGIVVVTSY